MPNTPIPPPPPVAGAMPVFYVPTSFSNVISKMFSYGEPEEPKDGHHAFVLEKIEAYEESLVAHGFDVPHSGLKLADARIDRAIELVREAREQLYQAKRALREAGR